MIKNTACYYVVDQQTDYDLGPTGVKGLECYEAFIYNRFHEIIDVVASLDRKNLDPRIQALYPGLTREMSDHIFPTWREWAELGPAQRPMQSKSKKKSKKKKK